MSARQRCVHGLCRLLQAQASSAGVSSSSTAAAGTAAQQPFSQTFASAGGTPCAWLRRCFSTHNPAARGGGAARASAPRAPPRAGPAAAKPSSNPAAAAGASGSATQPTLSSFGQWWQQFQRVPTVPKVLGLMGAIPFIALAPPVCKHLAPVLPTSCVENCGMFQLCYGVSIVTFLGAVHWGVAMASPLNNPIALRIANEAFVWSVIPSLISCPVALMQPGPGAMVLSVLLPACYLADYTRRNLGLPVWYMALRVPLTMLATFGMLLTATQWAYQETDRMKEMQEQGGSASS